MRTWTWIGGVIALALLTPVAAVAKPEPREAGPFGSSLTSDGARYIAWAEGLVVHVKDTRTGGSFSVTTPQTCGFRDVGGGQLLFACSAGEGRDPTCGTTAPLLYSIRHRAFHWPAGVDELRSRQGYRDTASVCVHYSYEEVGRHGIFYRHIGRSQDISGLHFNWHSGEHPPTRETETVAIDLDQRDLLTDICEPLQRAPNPHYDGEDVFGPGPYYEQPVRGDFSVHAVGRGENGVYRKLYLERCGSGDRHRLTPMARVFGMTSRAVWWEQWESIHVYILRSGRHFRYRFRDEVTFGDPGVVVAATNTRLFLRGDSGTTYVLRTPKR